MLSNGKANQSLAKVEGDEDYPNTRILDTYSLEFLDLPIQYSERDLKKSYNFKYEGFYFRNWKRLYLCWRRI